jgi:diguanylate cyclase (GGDEF)-like protein
VLQVWWRRQEKPSAESLRRAVADLPGADGSPSPSGRTAQDSGVLSIGASKVVFARWVIGGRGEVAPPAGRLYLARELGGDLLAETAFAIPGRLSLVGPEALPKDRIRARSPWLVWWVTDDRVAVAWPAKDCAGRTIGYFQAESCVAQIEHQAATTRRTALILLLLSAAAMLLVVAATRMFLVHPLTRLLGRLPRVQAGEYAPEALTQGLHGEPLMLARRLQSALETMSELSKTDELTGLANRRQLDECLQRAFHQARRYSHPLSVMVMGIDLFKAVNDTKGHQAGDVVIREIARAIERCCRKADIPARLGGDEFAVLLPETSASEAATVAERIRKAVVEGSEFNLSVSIGVADLHGGKIADAQDLVALADEALYAAKQRGRNRFVLAHEMGDDGWSDSNQEADRVQMLRRKLAGLDTQFKSLFVRALQEIVQVMERRDPYMADHARKVRHYSALIGRQMELSEDLIKQIELGALLHDIGMLALPDSVALCPGRLDDEQFETMKRHALIGAQVLEGMEFVEQVIPIARFHHERFDGKGYPEGLSGLGIPPICRIVAVADAFDAMTSSRAFRDGMDPATAVEEIRKSAGAQFDPDIVEAFLAVARRLGDRLMTVRMSAPALEEPEAAATDRPDEVAPVR